MRETSENIKQIAYREKTVEEILTLEFPPILNFIPDDQSNNEVAPENAEKEDNHYKTVWDNFHEQLKDATALPFAELEFPKPAPPPTHEGFSTPYIVVHENIKGAESANPAFGFTSEDNQLFIEVANNNLSLISPSPFQPVVTELFMNSFVNPPSSNFDIITNIPLSFQDDSIDKFESVPLSLSDVDSQLGQIDLSAVSESENSVTINVSLPPLQILESIDVVPLAPSGIVLEQL